MAFKTTLKFVKSWILALCLSQVSLAGEGKGGFSARLDVMTQNLYVGSSFFQVLNGTPEDVPFNVATIFSDIQL